MEVGNILRNFCLESTTISKAARQEGVKREREGTGSREGIREGGRAVSQWGGRGSACFVPFPFAPFCAHFFFNYSLPLSHAPTEGEEKGFGLEGTLLFALICCQARRGSLENCAAHLKCGCLFSCCCLRARQSF